MLGHAYSEFTQFFPKPGWVEHDAREIWDVTRRVAREALEQGKREADHWAHLTIHGILHLLGHDHKQPAEALAMEALETDILAKLDIPDPYQKDT